jgi:hypothetical protein
VELTIHAREIRFPRRPGDALGISRGSKVAYQREHPTATEADGRSRARRGAALGAE